MRKFPWLLCLAVLPVGAETIDVSRATSVLLHEGESLSFNLSARAYAANAVKQGLPVDPTALAFKLFSEWGTTGEFSVSLTSADGSVFIPFEDTLDFTPGVVRVGLDSHPASILSGSFQFSAAQSAALFADTGALLVFRSVSGDVQLGFSSFALQNDLCGMLSGGIAGKKLTAGAMQGKVLWESAPQSMLLVAPDEIQGVPEPATAALLLAGSGVFVLWTLRRRSVRSRTLSCAKQIAAGRIQ